MGIESIQAVIFHSIIAFKEIGIIIMTGKCKNILLVCVYNIIFSFFIIYLFFFFKVVALVFFHLCVACFIFLVFIMVFEFKLFIDAVVYIIARMNTR